jgi:phosphomannomutase
MSARPLPSIFREYDIRGTYGSTLSDADAQAIGGALAAMLREENPGLARPAMAVGRDGRLSSPALEAALVEGLLAGGVDVLRIGVGPTPMLYYAEASMQQLGGQQVQGGVQITGSHNPADENGFKIVFAGVRSSVRVSSVSDRSRGPCPLRPARLRRRVGPCAIWLSSRLMSAACCKGSTGSNQRAGRAAACASAGMPATGPPARAHIPRHLPGEHHLLLPK